MQSKNRVIENIKRAAPAVKTHLKEPYGRIWGDENGASGRGIGAAVSAALKEAGYHVAATYHGNDAAAAKFKAERGIATYKWDVSNYKKCTEGLKKVEADLGPIDILINNAGITHDTAFHKMTPEQWYEVINTNLTRCSI